MLHKSLGLEEQPLIAASAVLEEGVLIGQRCVIKAGAYLCSGTVLHEDVYIGANVAFSDDTSTQTGTVVQSGARIGANSTIHRGLLIAANAVIRPGSLVSRSVPSAAIVEGNPAAIIGYVDTERELSTQVQQSAGTIGPTRSTPVRGVTVHDLPLVLDLRGNLTVGEFDRHIPFKPLRYFTVFGVPNREVRGEHAHIVCHQFLICLRGSCAVVADDGLRRFEITLDQPTRGLYLPPMTWGIQYKYSPDALLLVFASHYYDNADYIRSYTDFIQRVNEETAAR